MRSSVSSTLWIFIAPEGGRLTTGWDSTVVDTAYVFAYGAYGPRRKRAQRAVTVPAGELAMLGGTTINGTINYHDEFANVDKGVRGGQLSTVCFGKSTPEQLFYDLFDGPNVSSVTNTGGFTVVCPTGFEYAEGTYTMTGFSSDGKGKEGAFAGTWLAEFLGATNVELHINNNTSAAAFSIAEEYIPQAFAKFGTSRAKMTIMASDLNNEQQNGTYPVNYCGTAFGGCTPSSVEHIRMNKSGVMGEDGIFTVMHEYGHGFQWVGIEPWQITSSCPTDHPFGSTTTLTCAFTEGFADFFSVWVSGSAITVNARYTDNAAEDNLERGNGNGSIVEGAVAGFLYDLVDGPSDPNGPQNQSGSDDDQVTWPPSLIIQTFQSCLLHATSTGLWHTKLDGIDQFIYCLDLPDVSPPWDPQTVINPSTGQRYFITGRLYDQTSVSVGFPPTWSKPYFRRLWLFNLFGQGSL